MRNKVLVLSATVLAMLFTAFSTRSVTNWFRYDGSVYNRANYLTPLNWTSIGTSTPSSPGANLRLFAIKVNPATEVYTNGPYKGMPKVDVLAAALPNDILNATGESDGTINEIANRVLLKP